MEPNETVVGADDPEVLRKVGSVNTYRTLCVAPPKEVMSLFMNLSGLALAG